MAARYICVFLGILTITAVALAGRNPNAKVAIHVLPHASRTCTENFPSISGCQDIITTEPSPDADCFPVFYDLDEFGGFRYALTWPDTSTCNCHFTSCSDWTVVDGFCACRMILQQWFTCQPGPVAIPGWAWITGYGMVCVVGVSITDCEDESDYPMCKSCAGIGGYVGDDPCRPTAGNLTTWGSIKSIFK